jgi:sn1-specific diacylglycerol lipase
MFADEGAKKYRKFRDGNDNIDTNEHHEFMHKKVAKLWLKRFKLAFCCVAKDEYGDEAFSQSAELFSHLFRGTDLVPSGL